MMFDAISQLSKLQVWFVFVIPYVLFFTPLPPGSFGEGVMFVCCSIVPFSYLFACLFVETEIVTAISREWLEQF